MEDPSNYNYPLIAASSASLLPLASSIRWMPLKKSPADRDGGAEVDETDAALGDDDVVQAQVEVDDAEGVVQDMEQFGRLAGELELREGAAAVAEPVHLEAADVAAGVGFHLEQTGDAA